MKIKVISRHPDEYQRETKHDIFKGWPLPVNPHPTQSIPAIPAPRSYSAFPQDPFRHQVEYTRALNAAKLERVFAKPFLASFDGHNEAVHLLERHPTRLSTMLSGARDGQVKVWHVTGRQCQQTVQAHSGPVNGGE
jgi:WD repeat and SOF domain-containing protein 1